MRTETHHGDYDDTLAEQLRAWARGYYPGEAAVDLLLAHRRWLARGDFRAACLGTDPHGEPGSQAWIDWDSVAAIVSPHDDLGLPASSSERQILALAASLAGTAVPWSLRDLITGLDAANTRLVLDAISHATGWHQTGPRWVPGWLTDTDGSDDA